jgi:hypothetical protein
LILIASSEGDMSDTKKKVRKEKRPIVSGIIFLGIGLFLLSQTTNLLPSIEHSWPIFIIIVGLALILGSLFRRKDSSDSQTDQNIR